MNMSGEKILIVDDDDKILKILRHCFEREGFTVVMAVDGEEALAVAKLEQPDLVVLDLMLPKVNGLDVGSILIAEYNMSVIILSAKGDELDRIIGFRMGVDDYIAKPFSTTELVLRVRAVLRRAKGKKQENNGIIISGNLRLDSMARSVIIDSEAIELTTKEFELLWLLASNPKQVFTRKQLLNKIWHSDYHGDENTVTVHMRRLREKIERDPSKPLYIRTVWGVGYKFQM
jgi:DNA-binding response OmpR family regulator